MKYQDYALQNYRYLNTNKESYILMTNGASEYFRIPKRVSDDTEQILFFDRLEVRAGDIRILYYDVNKNLLTSVPELLLIKSEVVTEIDAIKYRTNYVVTMGDIREASEAGAAYFQIKASYDVYNGCAVAAFSYFNLDPVAAFKKDLPFLSQIDNSPLKEQSVRLFLLREDNDIEYALKHPDMTVTFEGSDTFTPLTTSIAQDVVIPCEGAEKGTVKSVTPQFSVDATFFAKPEYINTIGNKYGDPGREIPKGTTIFSITGTAHGYASGSTVQCIIETESGKITTVLCESPDTEDQTVSYTIEIPNTGGTYWIQPPEEGMVIHNIDLEVTFQLGDIQHIAGTDTSPSSVYYADFILPESVHYVEFTNCVEQFNTRLVCLEGQVISGSVNVNGSSAIRRTGSLQMLPDEQTINILKHDNLININTKFALEVGFKNTTPFYTDIETLWLPQGVFLVTGCNIKEELNKITLSVTFKDKSAFLNGELGGVLPASFEMNFKDVLTSEGKVEKQPILVKEMVTGLVKVYSSLEDDEIIIDIPDKTLKALMWRATQDAYLVEIEENGRFQAKLHLDYNEAIKTLNDWGVNAKLRLITYGSSIGWAYDDFTYSDKSVTANAGENVITLLNKLTNLFVNYEFFVDSLGVFRFQEKKDSVLDKSAIEYSYKFTDDNGIISTYNNSPQYLNVKNDFIIWGEQATVDGYKSPIMYHFAFDNPRTTLRRTPVSHVKEGKYTKWSIAPWVDVPAGTTHLEVKGTITRTSDGTPLAIAMYGDKLKSQVQPLWGIDEIESLNNGVVLSTARVDGAIEFLQEKKKIYIGAFDELEGFDSNLQISFYNNNTLLNIVNMTTTNCYWVKPVHFMEQVYLVGADQNYYYQELDAHLYRLVDLGASQGVRIKAWQELETNKSKASYWLDCMFDESLENQLIYVKDIGRRTKVFNNSDINCIEEEQEVVPYVINIANDTSDDGYVDMKQLSIPEYMAEGFALGGVQNGAREFIRSILHNYISFNESVSITCNPIYYLEPNTIARIDRAQASISGDYTINTFNIPLDTKSQMTIQLKRNLEMLTSDK